MQNFYTGIGSRETPSDVCTTFSLLAYKFELDGWVLRSGAADGADSAFESGVESGDGSWAKEIYLPWSGFNGSKGIVASSEQWEKAELLASQFHPLWAFLKPPVRKLHARNCFQVMGLDLNTPSKLVVCWTKDGAESQAHRTKNTGGTGMAIAIADHHGVPIVNFANAGAVDRLSEIIRLNLFSFEFEAIDSIKNSQPSQVI